MKKLSRNCSPTIQRWMNEWCIYIVLYCTPKALDNHEGDLSSTTTCVQHPPGWCDGCHKTTAPVRSPATSGEERVIEPIKWLGIIRRPWLTRASGGNLARTPGYTPTRYEKCHGIFNDHRESGPQFNMTICWGIRTHTDPRVSTPCWPH